MDKITKEALACLARDCVMLHKKDRFETMIYLNGGGTFSFFVNGETLCNTEPATLKSVQNIRTKLVQMYEEMVNNSCVPTFYAPEIFFDRVSGKNHSILEEIGSTWEEVYDYCIRNDYNGKIVEVDEGHMTIHAIDDHRDNDLWVDVARNMKD